MNEITIKYLCQFFGVEELTNETYAIANVDPSIVAEIEAALGIDPIAQPDDTLYIDGSLIVPNVTQSKLDAIIAGIDVAATKANQQWVLVRKRREPLLAQADIAINTCLDKGIDPSAWRTYRQALRDVTAQPDPFNVTWPKPPAKP